MIGKCKLFILSALLISINVHAQWIACPIKFSHDTCAPGKDTIGRGMIVLLDTTVTSFRMTLCFNGGIMERTYTGNSFQVPFHANVGNVIVISEIISEPRQGIRVRLPAMKFVIE